MSQPTPDGPQPGARRHAAGAVIALGAALAVIGGIATYSALHTPAPAAAASSGGRRVLGAAGSAEATIAAGLDSAAKYQRDGKFAEAAAVLAKLTEVDAADQPVRLAYAQALMGLRKFPEAYSQYEAALALQPAGGAPRAAGGDDKTGAQLHFEAGTCASMAGGAAMLDRAIEHYSMAQTADRLEPKYPLYLAMVQLKKGDKENQEAAVASLVRATRLNPDLGEAWGTLAEIALRNDEPGLAAQHLEKARRLQPDSVRWRVVEARVLNRRGEGERAAAALTALRPEQRRDPTVLTVLGESYGLMKRPRDAAEMYEEVFKAAPSGTAGAGAELAYQSALWFERAGDVEKARVMAAAAATLGHGDAREMAARLAR